MPSYKGHIAGALVVGGMVLALAVLAGFYEASLITKAALIATAVLAALFPDVDTDSVGKVVFYWLLLIVDGVLIFKGMYVWASFVGLFAILPGLQHHRGWTHTIWAMFLVPAPVILLPMFLLHEPWDVWLPFYLAAVTGYLSHLALDGEFKF